MPASSAAPATPSSANDQESRLEAKIATTASSQTRWFLAGQLVLVAATIGSITSLAH
jgi:hypothetical protein